MRGRVRADSILKRGNSATPPGVAAALPTFYNVFSRKEIEWRGNDLVRTEASFVGVSVVETAIASDSPPHVSQYKSGGKIPRNLGLPKLLTHKLQTTIIIRCQLFDIVSKVLQVSLFNTVSFSTHFKIISAVK